MWYFVWVIAVLLLLASGVLATLWVESRRASTPLTNIKHVQGIDVESAY